VSNWNVIPIVPHDSTTLISTTFTGIASTTLVDSNGFVTPVSFTAVGVNDGYHEALTITSSDTASARMMNTYWYGNPLRYTPAGNNIVFTVTNLPNDTYNVYVYLLQQVSSGSGGPVEVYDSTFTNYVEYSENFSSTSNFVTAVNTTGLGVLPYANYVELQISTGGSNSVSFTESGTVNGVGGSGVTGVQIVPVPPSPVSIIQQPASQRVITNTPAAFTVQANGFPLAYQWYGISAGVTNAIAGATNSSYTTPPVLDSDNGTGFFVVVSNFLNQVQSSTAYLTAGHMVTASGLVIDNQYFDVLAFPYIFAEDMYPDATWFAATPTANIEYLNTFESAVNDLPVEPPPAQPEAEQIYGWFTPAVSGDYVFFVTSDDEGTLWLSTNNSPANSYLIAQNQSGMVELDWTCTDTGCGEFTGGYATGGEFRSDLFISGGGQEAISGYYTTWEPTPNFNSNDNGITLVAGTPYYLELDNSYAGNDTQCAAVTYKLAGNSDPTTGSASLLTGDNISSSVPDFALPAPTPVITSIALAAAGSKVIIHADNGLLNAQCNVQTSTNLTQPWVTSASGWFDLNGNFSITNAIVPNTPHTFYRLQEVPQ